MRKSTAIFALAGIYFGAILTFWVGLAYILIHYLIKFW